MKSNLHAILLCIFITYNLSAQNEKSDSNIIGHVVSEGKHIPFVHIVVKGTTIGTSTDETGHYQLINLKPGEVVIKAHAVGLKDQEVTVVIQPGETKEVKFDLEPDIMGLSEVVITGDRNDKNRKESALIVNTLTPKLFTAVEALNASESLNYIPGLRMENNCQNCGFNQVRMNGLEGPYSQILINNRPVFSGLLGVYGLELFPANMIERIEVVRGGGSAMYGSNAIAGTINLILKDPVNNSYEFGSTAGLEGYGISGSGKPASDYTVHANASVISNDLKTGMALYGFYRNRQPFDANDDGFSELPRIGNTTFGSRIFHRFGYRSKLALDFFNIQEKRRGGDKFDSPPHMADIAEATGHNILSGALTYEKFFRKTDLFTAYVAAVNVNRDSYYGAEQSLKDYGLTESFAYNAGVQYHAYLGLSSITAGAETNGETLKDTKLGYPDVESAVHLNDSVIYIPYVGNRIIADQITNTIGFFAQYELKLEKWLFSLGARFDSYQIKNMNQKNSDKSGNVFSPRISVLYDISSSLQARASVSSGYRAPQVFDEDLHIETSGSRQVIHQNDPDLKQETSKSATLSLDYGKLAGKAMFNVLLEGFYTRLDNAFVNEYGIPDSAGVVIYTRKNVSNGAMVYGVNIELNIFLGRMLNIYSGFTTQKSQYEKPQDFDSKDFFRTPENYGFLTLEWKPDNKLALSASGIYTGKMKVPYFGYDQPDPETGMLKTSPDFFDMGLKFSYDIKLNGASLQVFAGAKNILNSYQDDFDRGIDRDPGYIYGPITPRSLYAGFRIGNLIGK
ncbi:MAG: TonB-dependent receptor [Bacteroidetes bacterium]|nr:TonB-dependent receptor [Bacteroidota bacterium]